MFPCFVLVIELFITYIILIRPLKVVLLKENIDVFYMVLCTLVIHMHVPKYLWSDTIFYACHLINRVSSILHSKTPFSFFLLQPCFPFYLDI